MARSTDKPTRATKLKDRSDLVDDLAEIRTAVNAIAAKLDADATVTDVDYSAHAVGTLRTKK